MVDVNPTRRGFLGLSLGLLGLPAAVKAIGGEPRPPAPSVEFVKVWVTEEMLDDCILDPPGGMCGYWYAEVTAREGAS